MDSRTAVPPNSACEEQVTCKDRLEEKPRQGAFFRLLKPDTFEASAGARLHRREHPDLVRRRTLPPSGISPQPEKGGSGQQAGRSRAAEKTGVAFRSCLCNLLFSFPKSGAKIPNTLNTLKGRGFVAPRRTPHDKNKPIKKSYRRHW